MEEVKPKKVIIDSPESSPVSRDSDRLNSDRDETVSPDPQSPAESPPESEPQTPAESPPKSEPRTPIDSPPKSEPRTPLISPKLSLLNPGADVPSPKYNSTSPAYMPDLDSDSQSTDGYAAFLSKKYPNAKMYADSPPFTTQQTNQPSPKYKPTSPAYMSPEVADLVKVSEKPDKNFKKSKKIVDIYSRTLVSKKVSVEMKYIGRNIKEILEKRLKDIHEGRCIAEGYVKKNSIKIISYSSGKISAFGVLYEISFECYVCFPVEGQLLNCIATNITKAGIKATSLENPSPFVVFISRDHQLTNNKFNTINEKDRFVARIIGQRFELNDPYISIIAEIDEKKKIY